MRLGKSRFLLPFTMAAAFTLSGLQVASAQTSAAITLSVPDFMATVITDEMLAEFEAQNPGVTIHLVTDQPQISPPAGDVATHLEEAAEYASSADVAFVDFFNVSVESTRAGVWLNLAPLTSGDPALNSADFFPTLWNAFQWDQGVWALPISSDLIVLNYDPAAFDAAGLAYPNAGWTMDDLANAARTLAQRDASGAVTQVGISTYGEGVGALITSLSGSGPNNPNELLSTPQLATPGYEALLTTWAELEAEGVVTSSYSSSADNVPMRIETSFGLMSFGDEDTVRAGSVLPGGHSALITQGFAVSAGTAAPEQAYALARFLSLRPALGNSFFGITPARQSLVGVESDPGEGRGNGPRMAARVMNFSPEVQAIIDESIATGFSNAELRFGVYLVQAINETIAGTDALTALQNAEANAMTNLQTADAADLAIVVPPPPAPVVLQPGEVALNFGIVSNVMPMPNEERWEQLASEFATADPQVGIVNLENAMTRDVSELSQTYDCYSMSSNPVQGMDVSQVLNIDPFLDTDPTFSRNDVIGNVLAQLQRDNKTWALPLVLQPQVLRYNRELFEQFGLPSPAGGWTVEQFTDALRTLKENEGDSSPFDSRDIGGTYLLQLIAAYGGLPLDYRTNPPTINYTDPATMNAIQQVLDLAKAGYINYQELGNVGGRMMVISSANEQPPIYSESLMGFGFEVQEIDGEVLPYGMAPFPTGSQFSGLSYDITTGFISSTSQSPDACYRWLSFLAQHPDLWSAMPARLSHINDANLMSTQNPDAAAMYTQIAAQMQDPNTIPFPTPIGSEDAIVNLLVRLWLNRAFDRYVMEDADLATELADAQLYTTAFIECVTTIPPRDPNNDDLFSYIQQYETCITTVDPSVGSLFGGD